MSPIRQLNVNSFQPHDVAELRLGDGTVIYTRGGGIDPPDGVVYAGHGSYTLEQDAPGVDWLEASDFSGLDQTYRSLPGTFDDWTGHVHDIAAKDGGEKIAVGYGFNSVNNPDEGELVFWDRAYSHNNETGHRLFATSNYIYGSVLSVAVGSSVYCGQSGGDISAYEDPDGSQEWTISNVYDDVNAMDVSRPSYDEEWLFASSGSDLAKIQGSWNGGSEEWLVPAHSSTIDAVEVAPDDDSVYSITDDEIRKTDASDGSETWMTTELGGLEDLVVVPNGALVMVVDSGTNVHGIDPADGSVAWSIATSPDYDYANQKLAVHPSSSAFYVGEDDNGGAIHLTGVSVATQETFNTTLGTGLHNSRNGLDSLLCTEYIPY